MNIIISNEIPQANGHYSQCIEHDGILYTSGQLPIIAENRSIPIGIESQTKLVLNKIEKILNAAGSSKNNVLQMRIYLSDIELWDKVNSIYSEFFGDHKPTRCIVSTGKLHYDCLIEAEAIAFK